MTARKHLWRVGGREFGAPWLVCVGSVLVMLGVGVQYTWGTFTVYISSPGLMRDWTDTATIYGFALASCVLPVTMMAGTELLPRIGPMAVTLLGAVLVPLGTVVVSQSAASLAVLIVGWGVLIGGGVGFAYGCAVRMPALWFPAHKGLVSGISLAAYGGGSFFFNLVIRALANPDGVPERAGSSADASTWARDYHDYMVRTVPRTLYVVAAIAFVLIAGGALFMQHPDPEALRNQRRKRRCCHGCCCRSQHTHSSETEMAEQTKESEENEEKKALEDKHDEEDDDNEETREEEEVLKDEETGTVIVDMPHYHSAADRQDAAEAAEAERQRQRRRGAAVDLSPLEMMRTPQFYMLFANYVLGPTAGFFVIGSYARFARAEATFAANFGLVGGLGAIGNAAGRLVCGRLADVLDYRRTMLLTTLLLAVFEYAYYYTRTSYAGYIVVTMLIYFCFGGMFSVLPVATTDAFGPTYSGHNYTIVFFASSIGSILQAVLLTTLINALSFQLIFVLMGSLALVAAIISLAFKPPGQGRWFALHITYK